MHRVLGFAVAGVLAAAPSAAANPTVAVDWTPKHAISGGTVVHRLTLSAGAVEEPVDVTVYGAALRVQGDVQVRPPLIIDVAPRFCAGPWSNLPRIDAPGNVAFTIRPHGTAIVEARRAVRAPLPPAADLSLDFWVEPRTGAEFSVKSAGPRYDGRIAVPVLIGVHRTAGGRTVIDGSVAPARTGRVDLYAFAPGERRRPARIGSAAVDPADSSFAYAGWRPRAAGTWWVFARYRSATRTYVNTASDCAAKVRVRRR